MKTRIRELLEAVKTGDISVDEALLEIKKEPFDDIGYAKVDHHRTVRQGMPEVIYGAGKTSDQIIGIIESMKKNATWAAMPCTICSSRRGSSSLSARNICRPRARACPWISLVSPAK